MKIDWLEWLGRGMQLGLVVLVVGGLYQWSAEASRKQEALCDVAMSHVEVLGAYAPRSANLKRAEKAVSDACSYDDYYAGE